MRKGCYDHVSDFNNYQPTIKDIYPYFQSGQSYSEGSGRNKTYTYRCGMVTPIGDIEISLWSNLAGSLIRKQGEQPLLEALEEWLSKGTYVGITRQEIHREALECHVIRIFDNPTWVDYIPFNRRYRPEILKNAHIVTIVSACCGIPGEVTQEQVEQAYEGKICCPHCGRWSEFVILPANSECQSEE